MEINSLNNWILRDIGTLSRIIHSKCDLKYKQYHLQKGQFVFLTRICENPGMNSIELSNLLKADKTTVSKALQKLSGDGYLSKVQDPADSRSFQLFPTSKALAVYDLIIAEENANVALCFQGFTENEIDAVNRLIKHMSENVESAWRDVKQCQRRPKNDPQS